MFTTPYMVNKIKPEEGGPLIRRLRPSHAEFRYYTVFSASTPLQVFHSKNGSICQVEKLNTRAPEGLVIC